MSRPKLTNAQIIARNEEKAELNATKRIYNRTAQATSTGKVENIPTAETVSEIKETQASGSEGGAQPSKKWKPFAGSRFDRNYSNPPVDPTLLNTPIPEGPSAASSTSSSSAHEALRGNTAPAGEQAAAQAAAQPKTTAEHISQELGTNKLNPLEAQESAERAADGSLAVYGQVWSWIGMAVKVSDSNLAKRHKANKLNMHGMFLHPEHDPRGRGQTIKEFIDDYNRQVEKNLAVTESFKAQVRQPLIRIFKKSGIGLSDEAFIAGIVLQDSLNKGAMCFQLSKIVHTALDSIEENYRHVNEIVEQRVAEALENERQRVVNEKNNQGPAPAAANNQTASNPATKEAKENGPVEQNSDQGINLMVNNPEGGNKAE